MAKNKNQNRQRDQHPQQQGPSRSADQSGEPQEQHSRGAMPEEHGMMSPSQAARKQQKKFGHN